MLRRTTLSMTFRLAVGGLLAATALVAGTRPFVMGSRGVVVSGHHQASDAGLDMLKAGGNAIDAGVATVFAQAVTEFDRFGIGGEVPILIYTAEAGRVVAINGQGQAPRKATIDWYRGNGIEAIPGDCFLSAPVPAAVGTLILALEKYGTMSLGEVLAPAIQIAETGFAVFPSFRQNLGRAARRMTAEWPTSARIFVPGGKVPEVGELLVQQDLASMYRRLAEAEAQAAGDGRVAGLRAAHDLFYKGEIAAEIVAFQKQFPCTDANGFTSTGLFEMEDLAAFRPRIEEPTRTTYRGVEVYKVGFWSQGPVLLQTLNLLEAYDIRSLGHNTVPYLHLLAEAMKLSYADREWYYADPDFVGVPERGLLSKAYADERRKLIDPASPSLKLQPGNPYPFHGGAVAHARIPETVAFTPDPPGTTGTRVADAHGNVFSATPSGGWFHTSPIVEGLGFVLGTRMQSFFLEAHRSNSLQPGKQPRTTLTPTLALKGGKPFMAWGTPGGDAQDQVNLQFLLNVLEFDMDIQSALDAPLIQILDFPPSFFPREVHPGVMRVETRMDPETVEGLKALGHRVQPSGPWSIGDATAVMVDLERGVLYGAAGPRRDKSYALAW
ncbi:MAG: gamma-glutamyltransferase family protein [Bryobacterales bacterium]|nr:gamma-glutamyltransferase family protein [Bryobacterales bacterium]